jgi:hypothetical protein
MARILYVCDYDSFWRGSGQSDVESLREQYNVLVPGFEGDPDPAIDSALRLLRQGEKFDLVIAGMRIPGAANLPEDGDRGWRAGEKFFNLLRREGYDIPLLISELATGLVRCDRHDKNAGCLILETGESVKVLVRDNIWMEDLEREIEAALAGNPQPPEPAQVPAPSP